MRASNRLVAAGLALFFLAILAANLRIPVNGATNFRHLTPSLAAQSTGPRLLVFGSSNALRGLSAGQLGAGLHLPAYNLAEFGIGTNVPFLLSQRVGAVARAGDIVILSDRAWRLPRWSAPAPLTRLFRRILPEGLAWVPYLRYNLYPQTPATDAAGDVIDHFPSQRYIAVPTSVDGRFTADGLALLREEAAIVQATGACVILAPTPLLLRPSALPAGLAAEAQRQALLARAGLAGLAVQDPSLYTDPADFLDQWHLNERGRQHWTANLVAEIRRRHLCGLGG